jgi:hypothetical protein
MIECPHCGKSGKHIEVTEINILEGAGSTTYEEYYRCSCGYTFVALIPRQEHNAIIYGIVREGGFERWV